MRRWGERGEEGGRRKPENIAQVVKNCKFHPLFRSFDNIYYCEGEVEKEGDEREGHQIMKNCNFHQFFRCFENTHYYQERGRNGRREKEGGEEGRHKRGKKRGEPSGS